MPKTFANYWGFCRGRPFVTCGGGALYVDKVQNVLDMIVAHRSMDVHAVLELQCWLPNMDV